MVLTLLVSLYKLGRFFAMAGAERLVVPECVSQAGSWAGGGSSREHREVSPGVNMDVRAALDRILPALHQTIARAKQASSPVELRKAIAEVFQLVEEAWGMPTVGRDVAKVLCDTIRLEGGLDLLLNLLYTAELETKCQAGRLLEQILVAENRDRIARIGLGVILNLAKERDVPQLAQSVSGILEHMFKHTEETCFQLISDGGLDAILYWCRWTDPVVLRHCAMALANCAMYGGQANQRLMIEKRTAEWLFPLIFSETGATQSLKRVVCYSTSSTTSSLAKKVLRMIGEEVPRRILPTVPNWKPCEVQTWLQQIGFNKYCQSFLDHQVDGDILLRLTEEELQEDLGMESSITRKRFFRELTELKTFANYSTCDRSNLADWLGSIDPKFRQYTYNLLTSGINRNFLHRVTEQQLQEDCHINTGFHRVRILTAAREMLHSPITLQTASDGTDVFISYRRSTGSQLASLLKVHLQLHGFSVFIDVEKLEAGKFEDKLIQSVMSARNFVLVLSPNALDKCMGDPECKDWVHKEIVTALNSGKNIVPVTDHFEWPDPETLPKDMRAVLKFNGIKWSHEYQEATIDKIIRFLQGRSSRDSSAGSENGLDCLPSLGQP
ncbi:SARM1 protein, partial [Chroicocephalus maculipennis]|nr:SARM1 protein [Chroicocephalus maculipennis]